MIDLVCLFGEYFP